MKTSYSLDSDASRWWWPQAAAGVVGAAAIAAILVVPATGLAPPVETTREGPRNPGPWFSTVDPDRERPCFLVRARWSGALDQPRPRCGDSSATREWWTDTRRPGLSSGP